MFNFYFIHHTVANAMLNHTSILVLLKKVFVCVCVCVCVWEAGGGNIVVIMYKWILSIFLLPSIQLPFSKRVIHTNTISIFKMVMVRLTEPFEHTSIV